MNRLDDLITLVKQVDPDILGLQEVCEWTSGDPPIIDYFAEAVGMNYYLAPTPWTMNLAIFCKYPLLETENLSEYVGYPGALRAVVQISDSQQLNCVVVHLDGDHPAVRNCQVDKLRRLMEAYTSRPTVLMGDMNCYATGQSASYLLKSGWEVASCFFFDAIYVFSKKAWRSESLTFSATPIGPNSFLNSGISDHTPVGAIVSIYDSPNPAMPSSTVSLPPAPNCGYELSPREVMSDWFNGTKLNTTKWQDVSDRGGTVGQKGTLMLSIDSTASSSARVQGKWRLEGDFDIQASFRLGEGWASPSTGHVNGAFLGVNIAGCDYHITRWRSSSEDKWFAWSTTGKLIGSRRTGATAGMYRLVRTGDTLAVYYDIGKGWEELARTSVPLEPAQVYIGNGSVDASLEFTTYIDNFLINSGSASY
jgi:hypothetical protein